MGESRCRGSVLAGEAPMQSLYLGRRLPIVVVFAFAAYPPGRLVGEPSRCVLPGEATCGCARSRRLEASAESHKSQRCGVWRHLRYLASPAEWVAYGFPRSFSIRPHTSLWPGTRTHHEVCAVYFCLILYHFVGRSTLRAFGRGVGC